MAISNHEKFKDIILPVIAILVSVITSSITIYVVHTNTSDTNKTSRENTIFAVTYLEKIKTYSNFMVKLRKVAVGFQDVYIDYRNKDVEYETYMFHKDSLRLYLKYLDYEKYNLNPFLNFKIREGLSKKTDEFIYNTEYYSGLSGSPKNERINYYYNEVYDPFYNYMDSTIYYELFPKN